MPKGAVRARLLPSVSFSRDAVHSVNLPLALLQERLESKARDFAESEIIKMMEVGSRVMHCFARRLTLLLHYSGPMRCFVCLAAAVINLLETLV